MEAMLNKAEFQGKNIFCQGIEIPGAVVCNWYSKKTHQPRNPSQHEKDSPDDSANRKKNCK